MHPVGPINMDRVPMNVLFPEDYRASCRMIAKDFVLLGSWITGFIVLLVWTAG